MASASAVGRLAGRVALVTGGGSGIGRAVCQTFAKEGARVAAVDLNKTGLEETLSTLGDGHHSFVKDISKSTDVTSLLTEIADRFPTVPTIAVNAAGITRDNFLLKLDEESFDQVIAVSLKGTFLVTKAVAQKMIEANLTNGSIINFGSLAGKVGNMGQANYSAAKGGVVSFSKTAAKELAQFGIRCNAIIPGFIETPMTSTVPDKVSQMVQLLTPLVRHGKPEEIAHACVFLASDESSYVTGTSIEVSGGLFM